MNFSPVKHFRIYQDCEECDGDGVINNLLIPAFNVQTMDFDIIDSKKCPSCMEQSKQDFYSYMEDKKGEK
jgi:hypothetical protein